MKSTEEFRTMLRQQFESAKSSNPVISLRRFARMANVSAATLSQFLSGKRDITVRTRAMICKALQIDPQPWVS